MPCYVAWNDYLIQDTPEYHRAKAEVQARLLAVQHIVGYYYGAAGLDLPRGSREAEAPHPPSPNTEKERRTWKAIAHHCACDGVHFCTLYDVCSIIDTTSDAGRSYWHVLMGCAHLMRSKPDVYRTTQADT